MEARGEGEIHGGVFGKGIHVHRTVEIPQDVDLSPVQGQKLGIRVPDDHQVEVMYLRSGEGFRVERGFRPGGGTEGKEDC